MRNQYPGPCYRCGTRVEAGDGHFEMTPRRAQAPGLPKWRTQHADCAIIWRGKPQPSQEEALAARQNAVPKRGAAE